MWPTLYGPGKFSPEYWRRVVKRWRDGQEFPEWVVPDPPPGFIRVKWYSQFEELGCEDGELEANIPLESTGYLNLTRIENLWGIDRCIPIDPWRMKRFNPGSPHLLSPIAIECLKDTQGAIRLIEEVTAPVKRLRAVRWRVIRFFRDCEDVPFVLGFLFLIAVFFVIRLLFYRDLWFGLWNLGANALVPPHSFLLAINLDVKFSSPSAA